MSKQELMEHLNEFSLDFTQTSALEKCILTDYDQDFDLDQSNKKLGSLEQLIEWCF